MNIRLKYVGVCANDQHEMTLHPRQGYKPKPCLRIGTILRVKEEWANYYGSYYRCYPPEGMEGHYTRSEHYDIPTSIAVITAGTPSTWKEATNLNHTSETPQTLWDKIKRKIESLKKLSLLKKKW